MASIERYRPVREGYQPPSLPAARPPGAPITTPASSTTTSAATAPGLPADPQPQSVASLRKRDVPPAAPSPPTHSSRTSPPRPGPGPGPGAPAIRNGTSPAAAVVAAAPAAPLPPLASQWYYTEEEMECTPSVLHGLSHTEERARRAKGVNFIYQAGIAVQPHALPQMTLYVAAVFFHRFYMRISMVEEQGGIHHYNIAATALFLANKTEENCFKTKNIIIAVAKIAQKNLSLVVDEQSKEYWRWRDSILTYEELMLETLTFDLMVANPYNQLWSQLRRLGQLPSKPLREAAWTFLNDAALTTLPLLLDARDIASASIFFASVASGDKIDDVQGAPWWQHLGANQHRITRAIQIMVAFYTENPLKKQQHGVIQGSPVFSLETTRRAHELSALHSSQLEAAAATRGSRLPLQPSQSQQSDARDSRDVTPMELDRSQPTQDGPADTTTQSLHGSSRSGGSGRSGESGETGEFDGSDVQLKVAADDASRHHHSPAYYKDAPDGRSASPEKRSASPEKKRKGADPDRTDQNGDQNGDQAEGRQSKRVRQDGGEE